MDENEYGFQKKKTVRDPLSHRIIEKRRRDRMNNCLADLARLLPQASLRKGRGRIEKTEIVELAIRHLRHLQAHPCTKPESCEFNNAAIRKYDLDLPNNDHDLQSLNVLNLNLPSATSSFQEGLFLGYQECCAQTMSYFRDHHKDLGHDEELVLSLMRHLEDGRDKIVSKFLDKFKSSGTELKSKDIEADGKKSSDSGNLSGGSSSCSGPGIANLDEGIHMKSEDPRPDLKSHNDDPNPPNQSHKDSGAPEQYLDYYEGDSSSACTPLSIEISDSYSCDETNGKVGSTTNGGSTSTSKPPLPTIIGSHSSNNSDSPTQLSSMNGRSSDEGSSTSNRINQKDHYKFKNTIKNRFTATEGGSEIHLRSSSWGSSEGSYNATIKRKKQPHLQGQGHHESSSPSMRTPNSKCLTPPPLQLFHPTKVPSPSPFHRPRAATVSTPFHHITPPSITLTKFSPQLPLLSVVNMKKLMETNDEGVKSPSNPSYSPNPSFGERSTTGGGHDVPAFVLHDSGLFYVPLTIDSSLLPFLGSELDLGHGPTPPPLHPVTISVCFLLSPSQQQHRNSICQGPAGPTTGLYPIPIHGYFKNDNGLQAAQMTSSRRASASPHLKVPKFDPLMVHQPNNSSFMMDRFVVDSQEQQQQVRGHGGMSPLNYNNYLLAGTPVQMRSHHHHNGLQPNALQMYQSIESNPVMEANTIRSNVGGKSSRSPSRKRRISSVSPSSVGYHSWAGDGRTKGYEDEGKSLSNFKYFNHDYFKLDESKVIEGEGRRLDPIGGGGGIESNCYNSGVKQLKGPSIVPEPSFIYNRCGSSRSSGTSSTFQGHSSSSLASNKKQKTSNKGNNESATNHCPSPNW